MDLGFTEEQEKLRAEIIAFIRKEVPPEINDEDDSDETFEFAKSFAKKLGERRWLTIGWPKEYGGGGYGHIEAAIIQEELYYHRAGFNTICHPGITFLGPGLLHFGTTEQKLRILPAISRGELIVSQSLTEPNAGSDLASVQTRAVRDGDFYILNGQKTFLTNIHRAHMTYLLVRTDTAAPKHKGLSVIMCDLKSPGITIRPLSTIDGIRYLSEVFFDDVRVPKENLVGEENLGFQHIQTILAFERGNTRYVGRYTRLFDDFLQFCRESHRNGKSICDNPFVQHKLAQLGTELEVWRLLAWRVIWIMSKNIVPTYEASALNLYVKQWWRHFAEVAMEILGPYGQLKNSKWAPLDGRIERLYMGSLGLSQAATTEIMKNIMAIRGLGLPRG